MKRSSWIVAGLLAGLMAAIFDGGSVLIAHTMFFSTTELVKTAVWAMLIALMTGALFGLLLALFSMIRPQSKNAQMTVIALLLTALAIPLFFALTNGPQASTIPARPLVVTVAALLAGIGVAVVIRAGTWLRHHRNNGPLLILFAGMLLALGALLTDHFILRRLYPAFHLGLLVTYFVTATIALAQWPRLPLTGRTTKSVTRLIMITLLVIGAIAGGSVSLFVLFAHHNSRFVLSETTKVSAKWLRQVSRMKNEDNTSAGSPSDPSENRETAQANISLPNTPILLISIDAMRADRINPQDPHARKVAPNINRLAASSVRFTRAYTALPHTSYAISSLLTGKFIKPLFDIPAVPTDQETLPEILRRFHYRSGGFFTRSVFFIDRDKFKPLENKAYGFVYHKMEYRFTAAQKVDQAIEFLNKLKPDQPSFTWVHLFEPHEPYKKECTLFGTDDEDRYDCEIHTADEEVGRLLEFVTKRTPAVIIVVTADHGEEFGDHGGYHHGTTLYDEQVRVPLLFHVPHISPKVVSEPVTLVDVAGTLLSLVDIPIPARMRSRDLSNLIADRPHKPGVAFSTLHSKRMVVDGHFKLIWDKDGDLDRLYDLKSDPKERRSVAAQYPDKVASMKRLIIAQEASYSAVELRPVKAGNTLMAWPVSIQKALGGDKTQVRRLVNYLGPNTPALIRHKAAQLFFQLWSPGQVVVPATDDSQDPETRCWIELAGTTQSPARGAILSQVIKSLKQQTECRARAVLTLLGLGKKNHLKEVLEIAQNEMMDTRLRAQAITLIGQAGNKRSAATIVPLLHNYHLRLVCARALVALKYRPGAKEIDAVITDERFPERISALEQARDALR